MKKSNWICNACGMSSGRRTSVQRHIDNPNIHNGGSRAVPLADYSVRLRTGIYQRRSPQMTSSESTDLDDLMIKIEKEVENQLIREIAGRIFSRLPNDDFRYNKLESLARGYIDNKMSKGLVRELFKSPG
jgi:hypothetical protein